jgi:hypothetical protein
MNRDSTGIYPHKGRFLTKFTFDGVDNYLGIFDTFEEAYKVRCEAIKECCNEPIEKNCRLCGDVFERKYTAQVFCSEKCRFLSKVDTSPGYGPKRNCWKWLGSKHGKGYGHFKVDGNVEKAHRVSVKLLKGIDIGDLQGCHTCDTPDCVNPDHVFIGTNEDNKNDRQEKKRHAHGETHARCLLTENEVLKIRDIEIGSHSEIAKRYGVSKGTVTHIRSRKTWRHLA